MEYRNLIVESAEFQKDSLNSLSPYIGRLRPECAQLLIQQYATPGEPIFDPFCGSGTVLLQGWKNGFDVYGNDLSPYAYVLSLGKMYPYKSLEEAQQALKKYEARIQKRASSISLDNVPTWVQEFYDPTTLREILACFYFFRRYKEWFLLSSLLGILHHQRPAFLSYPASHGAPYLRTQKYPREIYPEMYAYKNAVEKLSEKITRTYKNFPTLNFEQTRNVFNKDISTMRLSNIPSGTIITSPPYMRSLTYARDNRLRLWFLGLEDWASLDNKISPVRKDFIELMQTAIKKWASYQKQGAKCVLVVGDIEILVDGKRKSLAEFIKDISSEYYLFIEAFQDPIPESHKLVKGNNNIKREIIVVLKRR